MDYKVYTICKQKHKFNYTTGNINVQIPDKRQKANNPSQWSLIMNTYVLATLYLVINV